MAFSQASLFGLPDEKKNIIWVLTWENDSYLKTGFAVSDSGHIMTTANLFNTGMIPLIKARRLDQDTFNIAELVKIFPEWNLAMLKVNNRTPFGQFPSNGDLVAKQSLLYIGHPNRYIGHCLFGRVSFPCLDMVTLPTLPTDGDTLTCKLYQSNETLPYRVLGDIYNSNYFRNKNDDTTTKFMEDLHPLIPIIQANGFCWNKEFEGEFGGDGLEGGPMFDSKGKVVGMMFTEEEGCQLGIHASLLKHFMGLCELS